MIRHECHEDNAEKFWGWIKSRGGVAVWRSVNLSNPGASWSTPALGEDGQPYSKPTWQADSKPFLVVTDPDEIKVYTAREVKRFRVAVRQSGFGSLKLTDAATRHVRAAVAKAGDGAYYIFDYGTQEAVIMQPDSEKTLTAWAVEKGLL